MKKEDLWRVPWIFSDKRETIRIVFGQKITKGTTISGKSALAASLPPELASFVEKYGAVILRALFDGKDTPFFGDGSDWGVAEHKSFLEDYINGATADELYEKHIGSDDDIDYFQYGYGADGDLYDIEDEYQPESLGITDAWYDLEGKFTLAEDIKYGLISKDWLEAANGLGILSWPPVKLNKLDKAYTAVQEKY